MAPATLLGRFASLGIAEQDPDETQAQKATLTLAAGLIAALSVIWVGTYWALGLPGSAAIPFAYQVATVATIVVFARTKSYRFFRASQAAMMTVFPFLLQWSLGGYVASSAVSLWALCRRGRHPVLLHRRRVRPVVRRVPGADRRVGRAGPDARAATPHRSRTPSGRRSSSSTSPASRWWSYAMLQYAVRARDAAFARSEGLLLNVLPRPIAERLKRSPGVIADAYDEVTVLFADIVDFTPFAERTEADARRRRCSTRSSASSTRSPRATASRRSRRSATPTWSRPACPSRAAGPRGGDGRHGARDARGVRRRVPAPRAPTSRSASAWRADRSSRASSAARSSSTTCGATR